MGDRPRANGSIGYERKIIRIRAVDSPNVRYALAQLTRINPRTGRLWVETDEGFAPRIVTGLRDYWTYKHKLDTLDPILATVSSWAAISTRGGTAVVGVGGGSPTARISPRGSGVRDGLRRLWRAIRQREATIRRGASETSSASSKCCR